MHLAAEHAVHVCVFLGIASATGLPALGVGLINRTIHRKLPLPSIISQELNIAVSLLWEH